jgi:hypothetical protein
MSSTEKENGSAFGMLNREEDGEDDEEEENDDGGIWFYVNKSGFPMDTFTYDRMWNHIMKLHPEGCTIMQKIKSAKDLQEVNSFSTSNTKSFKMYNHNFNNQ